MPTEIILPTLGESISEAVLIRWLKHPGEAVRRGDVLAEIETDKATLELESPDHGILQEISAQEGAVVRIGQRLGLVIRPDETVPTPSEGDEPAPAESKPEQAALQDIPTRAANNPAGQRISPAARRKAFELGIDINQVPASHPGARITSEDVERFAERQPEKEVQQASGWLPFRNEELTGLRKITAQKMTASARDIPQFSVSLEADATAMVATLDELRSKLLGQGLKVSVTGLLAYLAARAIQDHPRVNARYDGDRIRIYETVNLAIAVSTPEGLAAPVLYQAEKRTFGEISSRIAEIASRARSGRLKLDDVRDTTFTLSNLGMFGITQFIPLIYPPQAAILGIGVIHPATVPLPDGNFRAIQRISLSLTADHRVLDGSDAAQFLAALQRAIELCRAEEIIL